MELDCIILVLFVFSLILFIFKVIIIVRGRKVTFDMLIVLYPYGLFSPPIIPILVI